MKNKEFKKCRGGATPLSQRAAGPAQQEVGENLTGHEINNGFDGIGLVKILRYYGTKIVRSNRNVGRHYQADRKYTKTIDTIDKTNYNSNMMNYKSEILKRVQGDKNVSEAHSKHLVPYCLSNLVSSKKAAFTLAEVLITLGIIGIVAAMTIPTITHNIQEMVLNNQFKKFYSTFKQAFLALQTIEGRPIKCFYWQENPYAGICTSTCDIRNEYGECASGLYCKETGKPIPSDYSGSRSECPSLYNDVFTKRLKVAKICEENALEKGCLPENIKGSDIVNAEKNPDGVYNPEGEFSDSKIKNTYPAIVLQDGTYIIQFGSKNSVGAVYAFDINGKKGPNKWGYDIYGTIFYGNAQNGIREFKSYGPVESGGKSFTTRLNLLGIK